MFYHYVQNNSGGAMDEDENVQQHVIIESDSASEADRIAETKGLYFDGVDDGRDCGCCGDRWNRAGKHCQSDTPCIYGEDAFSEPKDVWKGLRWTPYLAAIHYKDRTVYLNHDRSVGSVFDPEKKLDEQ